jgi:hypothetical protein
VLYYLQRSTWCHLREWGTRIVYRNFIELRKNIPACPINASLTGFDSDLKLEKEAVYATSVQAVNLSSGVPYGGRQMKGKRQLIFVIVAFIAAFALVTGSVAAKATRTEYIGINTRLPPLDMGTWTYPGGNVHMRGMVIQIYQEATDPRCTGLKTGIANANWDENMTGRVWGTARLVVDGGGGVWEGTFYGVIHADGSESVRATVHGIEGPVKGLKIKAVGEFPADQSQPGIETGVILDPHGE